MSTTQTTCNIHEKIIKNMDCSPYTCCVFLALTKLFDTVNHAILLHQMEDNFWNVVITTAIIQKLLLK